MGGDIYIVGLEKSGSFVEHAEQVSKKMLPKQILLLGNKYIYKYIIPGQARNNEPYASSSYYGHKLIFKSEHSNVYVATIPNTQALAEPQIKDYIHIHEVLLVIPSQKEHCSELRSQAFRELRANHSEDREPSIPTSGSQGFRAKGACKGLQN